MVEQKYIDYWRDRQARQKRYHQQLAEKARQEVTQMASLLVDQYDVQRIILFGSLTRDRFVAESDIDLAVEGLAPAKYFEVLSRLNQMAERSVDLKLWDDLDPHFQSRVLVTGEVIYARE